MTSIEAIMEEGQSNELHDNTSSVPFPEELYAVAKFMDRDPDLWVFRRFGSLQLFNILSIQQRVIVLDEELQRRISAKPQLDCKNLIPKIQHTLKEYNDALAAQAKFRSYLEPEVHTLKLIDEWSQSSKPALRNGLNISGGVQSYKDTAAIAATEKTWAHKLIDRHRRLNGLFEDKRASKGMWPILIYYEEGVRRAEAVIIHVGFCFFLLCPVVALLYMESRLWKLVVLAVFLLAVSVLSVSLLNTPNKAGLGLVAGYAAILVVFLSNNAGS